MTPTDEMNRRQFLRHGRYALPALCLSGWWSELFRRRRPDDPTAEKARLPEAMFWEHGPGRTVRCALCYRSCRIPEGGRGFCGVRVNVEGTLRTMVFGNMAAVTFGPVEKKPVHHYLPGARANNYGTAGCNLRCRFCHNWHLSQRKLEELDRYETLTPQEAVGRAKRRDAAMVSFTYNEPTTFYEFMLQTAELARQEGLKINVNTNAVMQEEPLRRLMKEGDSATVDLKGFEESFYRDICSGRLEPVLENIKIMVEMGVWVELVNLVIPGLNDDDEVVRGMCRWIVENAGPETPLHVNRFTPAYRLTDVRATPVRTLERARGIAKEEGLHYVYIGNVPGHENNSTFCPECGTRVIHRVHFSIRRIRMEDGKCGECDHPIPGVWG